MLNFTAELKKKKKLRVKNDLWPKKELIFIQLGWSNEHAKTQSQIVVRSLFLHKTHILNKEL